MRMQRQIEQCGWLLLIALCAMVLAFMGLSLAITATGTVYLPSVAFAADRLVTAQGASLAAAEIRTAYEAWRAAKGHEPLSQQKLSAELLRLGCSNWKTCGIIRYRDLQLVG